MNQTVLACTLMILAGGIAGCAEPADAPSVDELDDPVIETALEDASDADALETEEAEAFTFRVDGEAGPSASYALDEGAECLVYGTYIVRLTPVEDGDGHTIDLVERPDGASPFELCDDEGVVELPVRAGVDTFVALDQTVLWTRRDSRGQDLLTGYDFDAAEEVFSEAVSSPVLKDADGLSYGGPPETMASMDALEAAGVTCPEADAWFTDGRTVAISRRLRYSFETSQTTDTGEALCLALDDA